MFLLVSSLLGFTETISAPCINLKQSRHFRFEGVLTYKIFPGAPNYEDVRKSDKAEPTYILRLRKPVCVTDDAFIGANQQIDRIQIFPDYSNRENPALWKALRASVGKSVIVEGAEPSGAYSGHHHAPLLLPITKITWAPPQGGS